jgi:hypothetical protein
LLMTHKHLLCSILLPHDIGEALDIGNRAVAGFCSPSFGGVAPRAENC